MLQRLSARYQKEIALGLIFLFFIPGLYEVKAGIIKAGNIIIVANNNYSSTLNNRSINNHLFGNNGQPMSNKKEFLENAKTDFEKIVRSSSSIPSPEKKADEPFIGGPSQPEMSAFKSVGSDNMVSPFTGDFSYNIPLLDVGGYPVNMFYNSGITMDQEASWVGLGWNINPGTITRNMRGLPDDFDGTDMVIKRQSFRPDKTWGVNTGASIEMAGFPLIGFGINAGASFNNKLGLALEAGVHASHSIAGIGGDSKTASLALSADLNASSRSGASFSPSVTHQVKNQEGQSGGLTGSIGVGYTYTSRQGLSSMHLNASLGGLSTQGYNSGGGSGIPVSATMTFNSTVSFAYPSIMPSISKRYTKTNLSINTSLGLEYFWVNPSFKLGGFFSQTKLDDNDKEVPVPAYGMLNLNKANKDKDALLDFNRANDGIYTPASPAMAMPVYTYDVFNIAGEGTGGSFRAFRGDIGHMHDPYVRTREENSAIGLDLGFGNLIAVGVDLSNVFSPTEAGDWKTNNGTGNIFSFQANKDTFQAAYFKNPGEKTIPDANYQNAIGNEDLIRFKLGNTGSATPILLPAFVRYDANRNKLGEKQITENTRKLSRDKRTQVISYLTAEESERVGMNSKIYAVKNQGAFENKVIFNTNCNKNGIDSFYRNHQTDHNPSWPAVLGNEQVPFRKKNHISEIDVLGSDGRKYVYGLPVYNKRQVDVTFSINKTQKQGESKVVYDDEDNTGSNKKGRDWIMDQQEMPAYTHSYLLTELLSPNYVDVTGNGLTEDDMGDGIKFNYSKADDYKWRTPIGTKTATYSEGLKTDIKDDKAHYIYGEREAWYLYSIESKNMVARFYVKNDRKDGRAVLNESGAMDPDHGMQRLDKISLFSKGDLVKYGDAARPIKTIRFFQSYKLCKNSSGPSELMSNSIIDSGKLTLDSIWITYNGNQRKPKSRYVFYYPADNNPNYYFDSNDRWGNYKPSSDNPNGMLNAEYPYSVQDKTKADKNAAAWTMNKILLPSGGVIKIDYESDSYAYVQDKKASSMCRVIGFGQGSSLPNPNDINKLYTNSGENDLVYLQLPYPITTGGKTELKARYLADIDQLYLKLAVEMPSGPGVAGIAGTENIGLYADIVDYGLVSPGVAWIKIAKLNNNHSPLVQGAIQFLKQQLPGKAYKGYDISEESGGTAIVTALSGMLASLEELFKGEFDQMIADKKCQNVTLEKSFARLSEPTGNKFGGGLRVKRITINDNWSKMTDQLKATYGQEYRYTTTELINGKLETISSGVAAWEPSIGGDENPHRQIMRYLDHNKCGPYDYGAIEMPIGEMLYPAPVVGYSKVEILSIHRDTVKNLPTREVLEFYTNKDFPYKSSLTSLTGDANVKYEPKLILQLLKIDAKKYITQSQGFLIETNDMNGKEKSRATYSALNPNSPVTYTENFYNTKLTTSKTQGFNHIFPTITKADGEVSNNLIGRDVEIMTDFREHTSETISKNIGINFNLSMYTWLPLSIGLMLSPPTHEKTMYRSASLLKVVTHFGMLDSVVVIDKGSMVSTKNLVYDAETGNPLLTRTQNEHNKPVYNFSYPAHWAYSGMGSAYKNIDAVYTGLNFEHGILTNAALKAPGLLEKVLESGDELYAISDNNARLTKSLPCDDNEASNTPWTTLNKDTVYKIWAVNTGKSGSATPSFVFMTSEGNPFNSLDTKVRIVRSGHRNMLDQAVGNITSLSNPIVGNQLVFNEATNIIQTAAATFKDTWRVDNVLYKKDSVVIDSSYGRIRKVKLNYEDFANIRYENRAGTTNNFIDKSDNINLWKRVRNFNYAIHSINDRSIGFLLYNFNNVPSTSRFFTALLSIYPHTNNRFSPPVYDPADHPNRHGATSSEDNIVAEITSLKNIWPSTVNSPANANSWVNTYFNNNNVSWAKGIIMPPTFGINEHRVSVYSQIIENRTSVLGSQNKIGLKLRLANDDIEPVRQCVNWVCTGSTPIYTTNRCFWSPNANCDEGQSGYSAIQYDCDNHPRIDYYYYTCGVTDSVPNPENDIYVNQKVLCTSVSHSSSVCISKFSRKAINPYVEGIYGNWRIDSTYAYYGDRKEDNFNTTTDTRTGGTIKNYKSFWNFAASNSNLPLTRNLQAADVWVWNSAITQYNRKGYEIENTDPLGRFNAGLYGYNQQLPIAVANNARVREIMFDGFEDYDYQSAANCASCPGRRYTNYTTPITMQVDSTQKHTGRNSLRVNAGQQIKLKAPITSVTEADRPYGSVINSSTISYTNTGLSGGTPGNGLKASFFNHAFVHPSVQVLEPAPSATSSLVHTISATAIGLSSSNLPPATPVSSEYFSVKWEGYVQAPVSGTYKLRGFANNGFRIKISGVQKTSNSTWTNSGTMNTETVEIQMVVGQTYTIEVSFYYNWGNPYQFALQWQLPNSGTFTNIPVASLYPPTATSFMNVTTSQQVCNRLDSSQVTGNALTDTFSLIQTKKMLLSAWVKVDTVNCCFPATYGPVNNVSTNSITINYAGSNDTKTMYPEGGIIEGWQRYESVFDVPATATSMEVTLNNHTTTGTGGNPQLVFFDDIRIQPYNANMKSFVYSASNLRLMAELDENNYASYYEYDDDGTLTRVKKETSKGIKTITETRSATQKKIVSDNP